MKLNRRMMKKLFDTVPTHIYQAVFKQLQQERLLHPEYRDDELLMKMLCDRKQEFTDE